LKPRILIGIVIVALLAVSVSFVYYTYSQPQTEQIEFDGVTFTVELATTPAAQQQGLSDRDSMPLDHGMLFIFGQQAEWGFWMHEMMFPLDIIWFNSSRRVVFIEQNLAPCTPASCPVYVPSTNAMYVLEVNAGFVASHGVKLGDTFSFV